VATRRTWPSLIPVGGESVLVDGAAYYIPLPVAAELLRLNIELKQAQAKREQMITAEFFSEARRLNLKLNPNDFDLSEGAPE